MFAAPLSREVLGKATWSLIHTIASAYPENPTARQQQLMLNFIESLYVYRCSSAVSSL
jgi:FAD-linked sulfhydryl oxidase